MQTKTFLVPNISCGHCVMAVQNEVRDLAGVSQVKADKDSRMVTVEWETPATWDQIKATLTAINYPPAES